MGPEEKKLRLLLRPRIEFEEILQCCSFSPRKSDFAELFYVFFSSSLFWFHCLHRFYLSLSDHEYQLELAIKSSARGKH